MPVARKCREKVRPNHKKIIASIVAQYARRGDSGAILRCRPTHAESQGLVPRKSHPSNDGKVIYPDVETARVAAMAFHLLLGGALASVYECERSQSGHAHITSKPQW